MPRRKRSGFRRRGAAGAVWPRPRGADLDDKVREEAGRPTGSGLKRTLAPVKEEDESADASSLVMETRDPFATSEIPPAQMQVMIEL